jgi:hypothetical protein
MSKNSMMAAIIGLAALAAAGNAGAAGGFDGTWSATVNCPT